MDSCYIAIINFFTALSPAFGNFRGAVLQGTLKDTARIVIEMSQALDKRDGTIVRTNYASTLLLKMFNTIRGEKLDPSNPNALSKKSILLFMGNLLCRAYYTIKSHASCANVFSNVNSSNIKFSNYPKAQLVEYRYFLGRFHLDRGELVKAYSYLFWAFENALASSSNKRLILKILVPASILLGRYPTLPLLQSYGLAELYWPLVTSAKSGNYGHFMQHLEGDYRPWFLKNRLHILLKNRSKIPLFRQVFYQAWIAVGRGDILHFKVLQKALELSMNGDPEGLFEKLNDEDYEITENISISLISQGFIKAKIFTRNQLIRLKPEGAFPPLPEVNQLAKNIIY